jgi:hypothetical protein
MTVHYNDSSVSQKDIISRMEDAYLQRLWTVTGVEINGEYGTACSGQWRSQQCQCGIPGELPLLISATAAVTRKESSDGTL